jgi:hypothetical protein
MVSMCGHTQTPGASWPAHLSESVFIAKKCCWGAQEDLCAFHCLDTSFADMTELSEACTVLGA